MSMCATRAQPTSFLAIVELLRLASPCFFFGLSRYPPLTLTHHRILLSRLPHHNQHAHPGNNEVRRHHRCYRPPGHGLSVQPVERRLHHPDVQRRGAHGRTDAAAGHRPLAAPGHHRHGRQGQWCVESSYWLFSSTYMLFGRAKRDAFRQSKGWPIQRSAAEKAAFHGAGRIDLRRNQYNFYGEP